MIFLATYHSKTSKKRGILFLNSKGFFVHVCSSSLLRVAWRKRRCKLSPPFGGKTEKKNGIYIFSSFTPRSSSEVSTVCLALPSPMHCAVASQLLQQRCSHKTAATREHCSAAAATAAVAEELATTHGSNSIEWHCPEGDWID